MNEILHIWSTISVQIAPHQSFVSVLPKMAMCLSVSLSLSGSKFLYWFDSRTSLAGILDKSSWCSCHVGKSSSMMSDGFVMSPSWMSYVHLPWQLVSNLTRQRQNYQETMNTLAQLYPMLHDHAKRMNICFWWKDAILLCIWVHGRKGQYYEDILILHGT